MTRMIVARVRVAVSNGNTLPGSLPLSRGPLELTSVLVTGDLSFGTFETLWKTSHPPIFGSIMGRPHHRERDDSPCRPLLNTERK